MYDEIIELKKVGPPLLPADSGGRASPSGGGRLISVEVPASHSGAFLSPLPSVGFWPPACSPLVWWAHTGGRCRLAGLACQTLPEGSPCPGPPSLLRSLLPLLPTEPRCSGQKFNAASFAAWTPTHRPHRPKMSSCGQHGVGSRFSPRADPRLCPSVRSDAHTAGARCRVGAGVPF